MLVGSCKLFLLFNLEKIEIFAVVYGSDIMLQAKHINEPFDSDLTIIKLMLIVLAFSSNCSAILEQEKPQIDCLLNGTFRFFGSQNVYAELLWKYMTYRYGYYDSVIRFSRLTTLVLNLLKYLAFISATNEIYHHLVDHIFAQIKQSLTMDQNILKPLWGRA